MAQTAHKTEEEKEEYFDPEDILNEKIELLAGMVMNSEHFIAFTGAGISTSCGIPDFRSGLNTVLQTGPGAWEKAAQKQKSDNNKNYKRVSMDRALPSYTHMALLQLHNEGLLKFLISQNVDGLHRRSGFPPQFMSELHGNTNLEKCLKCKREYMRDFRVRTAQHVKEHQTGRKCEDPKCRGELQDSIINFGENLPERDMDDGFLHSQLADLCIAMGSSLRVTPAADMPREVGRRDKHLVVINIQKTPLDDLCSLRIFAMCDKVMEKLMKRLQIKVEKFVLKRWLEVTQTQKQIQFQGVDSDCSPYSYIKEVRVKQADNKFISLTKEPFTIPMEKQVHMLDLQLVFFAHYDEPILPFSIPIEALKQDEKQKITFQLDYDPYQMKWLKAALL